MLSLFETPDHAQEKRGSVIVLGSVCAGKKSMFQCMGNPGKPPAPTLGLLPLSFTSTKILDTPDSSSSDVWCFNDASQRGLLQFLLSPETLQRTAFVVALDLSKPWQIFDALSEWFGVIREALAEASKSKPGMGEALKQGRSRLRDHVRLFGVDKATAESKEAADAIELGEGVLLENFGVQVVVCGCKSDRLHASVSEEQALYMQQKIREACLRNGAGVVFTSATENVNTLTLQRYLFHRMFPLEVKACPEANVLTPNNLFIPAGFDTVDIIRNSYTGDFFGKPNGVVVPEPPAAQAHDGGARKETVTAYPDDVFLTRLWEKQEKDGKGKEKSQKDNPKLIKKFIASRRGEDGGGDVAGQTGSPALGSSVQGSNGKKGDDPKENPKLIKNFFQSLLKEPGKRSGRSSGKKKKSSSSSSINLK